MTDLRQSAPANVAFIPPQINTLEDTGLSSLWLQDLVLKVLYFRGYMTGFKVAEEIALPMAGVTDQLLTALKLEKFIEVKSSQGELGEGAYTYGITTAGTLRTARRWSAVNMQGRRLCLLKFITNQFDARKAGGFRLPRAPCDKSFRSW